MYKIIYTHIIKQENEIYINSENIDQVQEEFNNMSHTELNSRNFTTSVTERSVIIKNIIKIN